MDRSGTAKPKLRELDIMRAICIAAVVMIHGTSSPVGELTEGGVTWSLYFWMNKINHFTVPVFLFISGLVLTYQYRDRWDSRSIIPFYVKRVNQVLIPYLIWSLFYYIAPQFYTTPYVFTVDVLEFLEELKWADTGYHLYFLLIVMQFYLIFPLLMTLAKKWRLRGTVMAWAGLALQAAYYMNEFYFHSFGHRASICMNYMAVFSFGAAVGMDYAAFRAWAERHVIKLGALALMVGGWFSWLFLWEVWYGPRIHNTVFEISLVTYSALMAAFLIGLASRWTSRSPGGRLYRMAASIGQASFGIYLMHPVFLTFWREKVRLPQFAGMYHVYTMGGIIWCFLGAWAVYAVYKAWTTRSMAGNGTGLKGNKSAGSARSAAG